MTASSRRALRRMFAAGLFGFATAAWATPIVIDFEVDPAGPVPSYTESGVTFTPMAPATMLAVLDMSFGRGIIATTPPFEPIRADIAGGASTVFVEVGDDSPDEDNIFLRAYSASDDLLAVDTGFLATTGVVTLGVSAPNIAYVIVGSVSTTNNSSVVLDTFGFEPAAVIPEPGRAALLAIGLAGLALWRRRRGA